MPHAYGQEPEELRGLVVAHAAVDIADAHLATDQRAFLQSSTVSSRAHLALRQVAEHLMVTGTSLHQGSTPEQAPTVDGNHSRSDARDGRPLALETSLAPFSRRPPPIPEIGQR